MGRVVIEKLTKVKGKKVRKAVIEDAFAILAECQDDGIINKKVERCRLLVMQALWGQVMQEMMEAKDMREFINSRQGQIERILYAID